MGRTAIIALLLLTGCVSTQTNQGSSAHIIEAETRVLSRVKPSDSFPSIMNSTIRHYATEMNKTRPGQIGYSIRVNVKAFRYKDPAMSLFVGDANSIKATIEVVDPQTNRVLSSFDEVFVDGPSALINGLTGAAIAATVTHDTSNKRLAKGLSKRIMQRFYSVGRVPEKIRDKINKRDVSIPPTEPISPLVQSSLETDLIPTVNSE